MTVDLDREITEIQYNVLNLRQRRLSQKNANDADNADFRRK